MRREPESSLSPQDAALHRRARARRLSWPLVISDGAALVLALIASLGLVWVIESPQWREGLRDWWATLGDSRLTLLALLVGLTLLLFGARSHYTRRRPFADELLDILKVFVIVAVVDAVVVYLAKWEFSRLWFLASWVLAIVFVPLARVGVKWMLLRAGRWQRPTAILGTGENAREAAEALRSEPLMGLDLVAFLVPPGEGVPAEQSIEIDGRRIPVIALGEDPDPALAGIGSPQVMVALESEQLFGNQRLLQKLSARNDDMSIIPPLRGLPLYGMEVTHFFSHEVLMLTVRNNLARPIPRFVKRLFDLIGSAVLLIVLAPFFAFLAWKIRQTDGPAIFGHVRVGQYGEKFKCLKFRTMVRDAERVLEELLQRDPEARAEWNRNFKLREDPRVTPIGRFLRATSLDELPQLWNVLKGEMSLVGPRPIIDAELERYGDQVGYYLEAKPGMTGLWQISGRNDTGYDDRVALDAWYARNWSVWYDIMILFKTIGVVVGRRGAY